MIHVRASAECEKGKKHRPLISTKMCRFQNWVYFNSTEYSEGSRNNYSFTDAASQRDRCPNKHQHFIIYFFFLLFFLMVPMCVVDYNILATSPGTRPRAKEPREMWGILPRRARKVCVLWKRWGAAGAAAQHWRKNEADPVDLSLALCMAICTVSVMAQCMVLLCRGWCSTRRCA